MVGAQIQPFPPQKVAVGGSHSFCLGAGGRKTYGFGKNQNNLFLDPLRAQFSRIDEVPNLLSNCPASARLYHIASGGNHAAAVFKEKNDDIGGNVIAWGFGIRGRLAHRDPMSDEDNADIEDAWNAPYPLRVTLPKTVLRVECGADCTFALTISNEVYAWGCNTDGQLGLGHQSDARTPQRIPEFGSENPAVQIQAGSRHSMILTKDMFLYVAGATANGRLGVGSRAVREHPNLCCWTLCPTLNSVCSSVACGESHSAGIEADGGSVWTWGAGSFGRLGHGDTLDGPVPMTVRNFDESAKQVALGAFHTVVLTSKGRLWSWGTGAPLGYMNDGDNAIVSIPRRLNFEFMGPVLQIAAGPFHTVALCSGGRLAVWGNGSHGRVGQGPATTNIPKPRFLTTGAGNKEFREAIRSNEIFDAGEKKIRAASPKGKEGDGEGGRSAWKVKQVQCGSLHTGALTEGGALYMWGCGESGQTGQRSSADLWLPRRLELAAVITKIAFGYEHCLCITSSMELYAWGRGGQGQLGINQAKSVDHPVLVNLPQGTMAKECAAGETHSGVVALDGKVYMWGSAEYGCLGLGNAIISGQQPEPRRIEHTIGSLKCSRIACGLAHTGVVTEDGDLYMFGAGWFGRLGLNTLDNVYAPQQVPLTRKVSDFGLAAYHTLVIDDRRDLYAWGRDSCVCEPMHCTLPKKFTQLGESVKVRAIACREGHSLAVTSEGEVYVWGDNLSHQLGLSKLLQRKHVQMPEQLGTLPGTVVAMATGPSHSVGIMGNGDLYAWGDQSCGRLGLTNIQDFRYVDTPSKVEPVWSSVEAMTHGSRDKKEAQKDDESLPPPADEDEDENIAEEAESPAKGASTKANNEPNEKDQLFGAMREGAGIKEFSTMQSLIKQEPASAKEAALNATEASLVKDYEIFLKDILVNVTEFERMKQEKLTDVDSAFKTTVKFMSHVKAPQHSGGAAGTSTSKKSKSQNAALKKLIGLLPRFEELVWSLQQQPAYLSELSMHIGDEAKERIFYRFVAALYVELHDDRTKHLFMALLKLMIKQEVEECKDPKQVFQPTRSRVFHLFSNFALQPYFREDIVHTLMDVSKKSGLMCTLDRGVKELGHHFYLTKDEFLQSSSGQENKDAQELTVEFNTNLERFREYILGDFMDWVTNLELPTDVQKMLYHALQTIKARRFTQTQDDMSIGLDLQICEPLARLYVQGVLMPQLENFAEYSGKMQGLGTPAQLQVAQDASIRNNVKKIAAFLKKLVNNSFVEPAEKQLAVIGRQLRPALLQFCKEQGAKSQDDTDTQLTIDVFVSHYDSSEHYVQLHTKDLLSVTQMLLEHESKIGLTEEDYLVMELIPPFAEICADAVISSIKPEQDVVFNFKMNSRFLLTSPSMVFCKTSKAPVPRRLSAETAAGGEDKIEVVKPYSLPEDPSDPRAVLQDLWNALPPLQSENFRDMKAEFEALKKHYANITPPDYDLTKKLDSGLKKIDELIAADTKTDDVLAYIIEQLLMRDRHRIYLENVDSGRRTIREAKSIYYLKMERVNVELSLMKRFCSDPKLPKQISDTAYEVAGVRLNMNQVAQKIATLRTVEPDDIPDGCSFAPQKTLPLSELLRTKVVKTVAHPTLDPLPEKTKKAKLFFTFSFNQVAGLDIVVVLHKSAKETAMIRKMSVPQRVLMDINKKAAGGDGAGGGGGGGKTEGETTTLDDGFLTVYLAGFSELQRKIVVN